LDIFIYEYCSSQAAYRSFNWGQNRTNKLKEKNGIKDKMVNNSMQHEKIGKSSTGTHVIGK